MYSVVVPYTYGTHNIRWKWCTDTLSPNSWHTDWDRHGGTLPTYISVKWEFANLEDYTLFVMTLI